MFLASIITVAKVVYLLAALSAGWAVGLGLVAAVVCIVARPVQACFAFWVETITDLAH